MCAYSAYLRAGRGGEAEEARLEASSRVPSAQHTQALTRGSGGEVEASESRALPLEYGEVGEHCPAPHAVRGARARGLRSVDASVDALSRRVAGVLQACCRSRITHTAVL
jgi:hypothetical protein